MSLGETLSWPDYVFDAGYMLRSLPQLERYIDLNGHLPGIPKQSQVAAEGFALDQMLALQLEKIEELTLHVIALQKQNDELRASKQRFETAEQALNQRLQALEEQ